MKLRPVKKDAGYFLRVWRAEHDLTQGDAAEYFGVNPTFISLIEAGRRFPAPPLAKAFSDATGAPIEAFLNMGDK